MSLNARGSSLHFTDEGAGAPEGLRRVSGASPTCRHLRPCPDWVRSLLLRSTWLNRAQRECVAKEAFAPGPRPCQKGASTGPRGSMREVGTLLFSGSPMGMLPLSLWQALSTNSSPKAAGWVLAGKPGQAGVSAALLASVQNQIRPALRDPLVPVVTSRHQPAPADPLIPTFPRGSPLPWAVLWEQICLLDNPSNN